jgi:hypothetical protein
MEKEGLSTTDLGEFLRWKAKNDNAKKARVAKAKIKKIDSTAKGHKFLTFLKTKREYRGL